MVMMLIIITMTLENGIKLSFSIQVNKHKNTECTILKNVQLFSYYICMFHLLMFLHIICMIFFTSKRFHTDINISKIIKLKLNFTLELFQ